MRKLRCRDVKLPKVIRLVSGEAEVCARAVSIQSSRSDHSGYHLSAKNIFQRYQSLSEVPCRVIFGVEFEGERGHVN